MDTHKKRQVRGPIGALLRWFALSLLFAGTHAFAQTGGTVTYVYTDPQGTPLAETDANGNITATFEYTPYGTYAPQGTSTPGAAPKGPGYTGHVNDSETNLVYMQARYYDPVTGQFLSTDPVPSKEGDALNFNRYAYVENNPINGIDPTGKYTDHLSGDQISCEIYQHNGCGTSRSGGDGGANGVASNVILRSSNQGGGTSGGNVVNQFDIGNDAHSTLQTIALSSSPFYFAETNRDPDGVYFGGRPDLGNIDLHYLWEIKPIGNTGGVAQLFGYIAMSKFTYAPGQLPDFFLGNREFTAQGVFATYTYHYTPTGVIYYTYKLKQNYQYKYNFFPRLNPRAVGAAAVMDILRGIVTSPGPVPVVP